MRRRNMRMNTVTAPTNTTNIDAQNLPEHYESSIFYGTTHYNGTQLHHLAANPDLGVATASNYGYPCMNPASGTRVHVPLNHGLNDQLPASHSYGLIGVSTDEQRSNSHFLNGSRRKRKNAEAIHGTIQNSNASASSSSLIESLNTRHADGFTGIDAPFSTVPHYIGNGTPFMEVSGSDRSVNTGHSHNQFIQGNYVHQPFHSAGPLWSDQQLSLSCGDGSITAWNQAPAMPYIHGSSVNGGVNGGNIHFPGYQETANNRSSSSFLPPHPINHQHYNFHLPIIPLPGFGGHNIAFHPHRQVAAPSYRISANNAFHTALDPFQDGMEMWPVHPGPVPATGFRIYRPHQAGVVPETTPRYRNLPHVRVLSADEVAILDFPDFYEEEDDLDDYHRDMRMDIEDMSYEELLELEEQIGNVSAGLSEKTITCQLKTRTYLSSATSIQAACVDQEADCCIICQANYKNQAKIGTLSCGHEYHADCLKKWLLVKNECPICKSEALTTERKDR